MRLVVLGIATLAIAGSGVAAKTRSGVKWVPLDRAKNGPSMRTVPVSDSQQLPTAPVPAIPPPSMVPQTQVGPTSAQSPPQVSSSGLQLTCLGTGTANKLKSASVFGGGNHSGLIGTVPYSGSSSGWGTIVGSEDRPFEDQVDLRLFNGDDRIRMPRTMLLPIHGGQAGWFKLKNVVADTRSIRGSAAVSLLNNPKVFIDRVTGTISISGRAGDYSGHCEAIDARAPPKF